MQRRKQHFTLVEIMIVVAIIGLLAAIAIPSFMKARESTQENACVENMRQIHGALQQMAMQEGLSDDDLDDLSESDFDSGDTDITDYIDGGEVPECPTGGTYSTDGDGDVECTEHGNHRGEST
ncbi:MAG: competence type IV pilus major pilin ComGC [Lentisphaeria bacterium]